MSAFFQREATFADRHIGLTRDAQASMLEVVGYEQLEDLMAAAIPPAVAAANAQAGDGGQLLALPPALSETEALAQLRALAGRNTVTTSLIGLGYYGTHTPAVIQRNVLENPSWYTAYTPYQPEISRAALRH